MNQTDTSVRSESESGVEIRTVARVGREYVSKGVPYLRHGIESGSLTAVIGGTSLLDGLRTLLVGDRRGGLAKLAFGATLLAIAERRFRSRVESGVDETDVVDTGLNVDAVADEADGIGKEDHASGGGTETEADIGTEAEEVDRLGEAAFDRQSREVPAPQRAFNQGYLAHSAEVFWGIRSRDDGVLVSQDYDAIAGRDGVRYVASSEIGDDVRELPIPDAVLDHWDETIGGGTAVTGGDDILFVTTDALSADHLLRVLPSKWPTACLDKG